MDVYHVSSNLGLMNQWNYWRVNWETRCGVWSGDWASEVFALLVEEHSDVLSGQVDIAVVSKVWVCLEGLDHVNLVSVGLEALSSDLEVAVWAWLAHTVLVEELVAFANVSDTLVTHSIDSESSLTPLASTSW